MVRFQLLKALTHDVVVAWEVLRLRRPLGGNLFVFLIPLISC